MESAMSLHPVALPGELTLYEWVFGKLVIPQAPQLQAPGIEGRCGFRLSRASMQVGQSLVDVGEFSSILQTGVRFHHCHELADELLVNLDTPLQIARAGLHLRLRTQRNQRNRTR